MRAKSWSVFAVLALAAVMVGWAVSRFSNAPAHGGASLGGPARASAVAGDSPRAALRPARRLPRTRASLAAGPASEMVSQVEHVRPQRDLTQALQPMPAWPGPWPSNVDDIKLTSEISARIDEYGGPSAVNKTLKFLSDLRTCLAGHKPEREGGVSAELDYRYDEKTDSLVGGEATLDQSTLTEQDDVAVLDCAAKIHTGQQFKVRPEARAELAGTNGYVWRTMINVPVENDRFYRWLLEGPPKRPGG
jgi:hypothetical protein